jgi:hypothetical protein
VPSVCDHVGSPTESGLVTSVARMVQSRCTLLQGLDMATPPIHWIGGVILVAGAGFEPATFNVMSLTGDLSSDIGK